MMENVSIVTVFTLSGLDYTLEIRIVLFCLTLLWYIMILVGNVTIIVIVVSDKSLHEPMYIFLCNLCANALYGTVGFYPKFLLDLLSSHVVSQAGCMLQGFVIHASLCSDYTILALMVYDRYMAICQPLLYNAIMTKKRVILLTFSSWFLSHCSMMMNTGSLLGSGLCGSHINRLYCINYMVLRLTCTVPKATNIVAYINILLYVSVMFVIACSYISLMYSCKSAQGKWAKFLKTCVPHLISLITFGTCAVLDLLYVRFGSDDVPQELQNFIALEILLFPPIVSPIVYGLQLNKIRRRITGVLSVVVNRREPKVEATMFCVHSDQSVRDQDFD